MNIVEKHILQEGWRNITVRVTATLDTTDMKQVSFVKPSDFFNNDAGLTLIGFRIDEAQFALGPNLGMVVEWNSDTPQQALSVAKSETFRFCESGGLHPAKNRSGYDGSLSFRTTGYQPGTIQNATAVLKLVKLYA